MRVTGTTRSTPCSVVAPMHYQCIRRTPRLQSVRFKPDGAPESVASIAADQVDTVQLGKSQLRVPALGVGTWSWGDSMGYWGYGVEYGKEQSREAFKALLDAGLTFMDTAEAYGKSEKFLGEFIKEAGPAGEAVQVATKFTPWPTRFAPKSVPDALKASLAHLQRPSVQLYMQHFPGFFNAAYVEGLAMCKQQGLCEAVGVSNFNAKRVKETARSLEALGVPLAVNQVHYSLLYRAPETNGVLEACREHGVTLVAYSPMAQGLLTGKYQPGSDAKPFGARAKLFTEARLIEVQPLLSAMKAIGDERDKTMAQVAINWLICKGVVPIPGAKNAKQVAEVAGALGWRLSEGEVVELGRQSLGLTPSKGAPLENI